MLFTGTECKKRWRSIRDHYRREKKEAMGTTGSAAKKKRAVYWDALRFLDAVDEERDSFSNVSAAVIDEPSNSPALNDLADLNEPEEDNRLQKTCTSYDVNIAKEQKSKESTPSAKGQGSEDTTFRCPKPKTRQENLTLLKYMRERKEDREHFKRCIEDIANSPTPQQSDNEIDLFFKTMAATVKKFRPDLATQTKMSVFKVVTQMELLNQQSPASNRTTFTNIHCEEVSPSSPASNTTPLTYSSYGDFTQSSPSHSTYSSTHSENAFATEEDIVSQAIARAFE